LTSGIQTADALSLVNATVLNNLAVPISNPFPLNAGSSQMFFLSTAQFCIENDFLFENTHIALHDLANGAFLALQQCCQNTLSCDGGSATVFGDSGLSTIVRVKNGDEECQGSIQVGGTIDSILGDIDIEELAQLFEEAAAFLAE
jgi:hypothetical protein